MAAQVGWEHWLQVLQASPPTSNRSLGNALTILINIHKRFFYDTFHSKYSDRYIVLSFRNGREQTMFLERMVSRLKARQTPDKADIVDLRISTLTLTEIKGLIRSDTDAEKMSKLYDQLKRDGKFPVFYTNTSEDIANGNSIKINMTYYKLDKPTVSSQLPFIYCESCGALPDKMITCSHCRLAKYCNSDCQLNDSLRHDMFCQQFAKIHEKLMIWWSRNGNQKS